MIDSLRYLARSLNFHYPITTHALRDLVVVSVPRSGSTWLKEMICCQPGFRYANEPFNLRNKHVRKNLGMTEWDELYDPENRQQILDYLKKFSSGQLKFMGPAPFMRFHRWTTNRIVFKMLHGGETILPDILSHLDARAVIMLRHPIPVALSRRDLPRIEAFDRSDFLGLLSSSQTAQIRRQLTGGSHLTRGVISWCCQQAAALRCVNDPRVSVITYEQMVLEPERVIAYLSERIPFEHPEWMLARIDVPSKSIVQSRGNVRQQIQDSDVDAVVGRWRKSVSRQEEAELMGLLDPFQIDAYGDGRMVSDKHWV